MSPRDRSPVRTSSPRQPSGKDHWNQWSPYTEFAAVGTNYWFVWPEGNCPPDWAWFLPRFFSPFCHRWSFHSLPLSPLACLVGDTSFPAISSTWLHRYYLNWTELDDAITKFKFKFKFKLSFIVIPLHVWTYSGTRCRASQDHGAT